MFSELNLMLLIEFTSPMLKKAKKM